ncbi:Os07g0594966 [Oryza sativa Japonica Group]|uniref:Os07g0594966 protein n=1 Tax=Oryza sativa subsp. japonica TaxID=39947 RepID=A0A0P0X890_ORYSJ|nr:hypothetical protein EE612_040432 [Oryza sativa]BAT02465.1 Os07g0594966 [Oryza sativa Japonica Group]
MNRRNRRARPRPAARPAPRQGEHGGRWLRRPRRHARAGELVGHRTRPGVVARPPRRVPAGALPPRRRQLRRRSGRARAALRAAAVRVRAADLSGDQPGEEDGGAGRGELAAGVRVAAEDVSMEELVGLSTRRKVPLVAVAEPRLPAHERR